MSFDVSTSAPSPGLADTATSTPVLRKTAATSLSRPLRPYGDGLACLALAGGTFLGRPLTPKGGADESLDRREARFSACLNGESVHCAVRIAADDDEGRERPIR